jgi:hypothetical protein
MDTLANQNRDQQNTINNCQTQALKLLAPEPERIIPLYANTEATYTDGQLTARFVLLTNHTISPIRMRVICDRQITTGYSWVLGSSSQSGGSGMNPDGTLSISIDAPAWTNLSPMIVVVKLAENKAPICTFTER